MNSLENSTLRIYANTTDKIGSDLLYEHLVSLAKEKGIINATVYRGIKDFAKSNKFNLFQFRKSPEKLPIIIELIDKTEVLEEFFKIIETDLLQVPNGCLATIRPIDAKFEKVGNIIN